MSLLPKGIITAGSLNPRSMVIFSQPKVGKTTLCASLKNSLLIDIEDGSDYVDAQKINVLSKARELNKSPLDVLKGVIDELQSANQANKGYVYESGILDTATALEELVLPIANNMYRNSPQGRNWQGDDVRSLPNGAGYQYTRKAFSNIIAMLKSCFKYFIILGHLKEKMVGAEGEEMSIKALDLTGKTSSILCSQVDAIGYMYRDEEGDTVINFQPSESLVAGSRSEHLKNKKIKVITTDVQSGKITTSWDEIFIKE